MILSDVQSFGEKILCNFCQGCEIEIKESLETITRNFENRDSVGPTWVADFLDETGDEREKKLTDVHMSVTEFLKHTNT